MSKFQLCFGDETLAVEGEFPTLGQLLPSFMLVDEHLNDVALELYRTDHKILVTLLSVDIDEHAGLNLLRSLRRHLERWPSLKILAITVDSPFSLHRSRREHGMPGTILLSTLRGRDFHRYYGVLIKDYPLSGFTAPSVILADRDDKVLYSERLNDTRDEFDWERLQAAISALYAPPPPRPLKANV
jgi:thiol peroxidase